MWILSVFEIRNGWKRNRFFFSEFTSEKTRFFLQSSTLVCGVGLKSVFIYFFKDLLSFACSELGRF